MMVRILQRKVVPNLAKALLVFIFSPCIVRSQVSFLKKDLLMGSTFGRETCGWDSETVGHGAAVDVPAPLLDRDEEEGSCSSCHPFGSGWKKLVALHCESASTMRTFFILGGPASADAARIVVMVL